MGMGDAYSRQRIFYSDISGSRNVLTSDSGTSNLTVNSKTAEQIFVQRIHVEVTTTAAQTLSFQDSAGSPISVVPSVSTASIAHFDFDFGPIGVPLTAGKNFQLVISGAGPGAWITWEGYVKRTVVGAP